MKKKNLLVLLLPISLSLAACQPETSQENPPISTGDPLPDHSDNTEVSSGSEDSGIHLDSIGAFFEEFEDATDYSIDMDFAIKSLNGNELSFQKEFDYNPDIYLAKQTFLDVSFIGGYVNKDDYVGAFGYGEEFVPLAMYEDETEYQNLKLNLKDIDTSIYRNFVNLDTYDLNLSVSSSGNPINYTDYNNMAVLMNTLDLTSIYQSGLVNAVTFNFIESSQSLEVSISGSLTIETLTTSFTADLSISLGSNLDADSINQIQALSFLDLGYESNEIEGIINKINSGYKIEGYEASMNDGSTSTGDIYSTADYIVYDYSDKTMELISGYAAKDGILYQVAPSETGTILSPYLLDTDIDELNSEMGTDYSAIELGKILFQSQFAIYLPEATMSLEQPQLYSYNSALRYYLQADVLNLFNISSEVDNDFFCLITQGLLPGGYMLGYSNIFKTTINFGYFGFGSNQGSAGLAYNSNLTTMSDFGSTNEVMEILLSRLI